MRPFTVSFQWGPRGGHQWRPNCQWGRGVCINGRFITQNINFTRENTSVNSARQSTGWAEVAWPFLWAARQLCGCLSHQQHPPRWGMGTQRDCLSFPKESLEAATSQLECLPRQACYQGSEGGTDPLFSRCGQGFNSVTVWLCG